MSPCTSLVPDHTHVETRPLTSVQIPYDLTDTKTGRSLPLDPLIQLRLYNFLRTTKTQPPLTLYAKGFSYITHYQLFVICLRKKKNWEYFGTRLIGMLLNSKLQKMYEFFIQRNRIKLPRIEDVWKNVNLTKNFKSVYVLLICIFLNWMSKISSLGTYHLKVLLS